MLHSLGFKERATEKTLTVEPCTQGLRFLLINHALDERVFIALNGEDLKSLFNLVGKRIGELEACENA